MLWYNSPEAAKALRETVLGTDGEVGRRTRLRLIDGVDRH